MQSSSIILNQVSVKLQDTEVLKDISFNLGSGEHLAITGSSGSGKTILAKVLAGQLYAFGNITITWDEFSSLQKKVILVEQRNQFKNLSLTSDFYYQQRFNSFDAGDSETVWQALETSGSGEGDAVISLLERLGLYERRNAPLIQLSSGENKRFQLVKAILSQPQILILDSPFTGLDLAARKHLNTMLGQLAADGTKIIIVTDASQIPDCITHIAVLQNGIMKCFSTKENWISETQTLFAMHPAIDFGAISATKPDAVYGSILSMRNVSVQYEDKIVLNNINWKVKQGEKWLLKGPNGAGKSTLLSLINGDNPQAYKNEIYLFDRRKGTGESIWDIKSKIGYVSPELHAFYNKSTSCFDAIASGFFDTIGLFRKISHHQQQQIQMWVNVFGLQTVQHKALAVLSFSTQRMILLARALVKNPVLLLLDEPCQGLDDEQRESFVHLINHISEYFDKTLIYVSHCKNEVPSCIEHVLSLHKGKSQIHSVKKEALLLQTL